MPEITPNLWFDTQGEEAATFYVSVFPNSSIKNVSYYGENAPRPAGTVLTVDFELDGERFTALNGGPEFTFDEAFSLVIDCADRQEVDHYWSKLSEGGEEGPCGWLKDKYGLSWQVVRREALMDLMNDPDPQRAQRAAQAMFGMKKLNVAELSRRRTARRQEKRGRRLGPPLLTWLLSAPRRAASAGCRRGVVRTPAGAAAGPRSPRRRGPRAHGRQPEGAVVHDERRAPQRVPRPHRPVEAEQRPVPGGPEAAGRRSGTRRGHRGAVPGRRRRRARGVRRAGSGRRLRS
ncbi:hypothetical protein SALBM135S_09181 [Streptomyces alboniger]